MQLLSKVRHFVRQHDLLQPDTRVAVALSGGPDSVALAHLVRELAASRDLVFAGLAHFNHQLRDTAARDEEFCGAIAASLGVRLEVGRADVRALAAGERSSIEAAAHRARHAFFDAARGRLAADVMAVGHTRDDQAETFLLRLLRGAGARGLAAMHPRAGTIVRPLLGCRRGELVAWLDARHIGYVVDETNADTSIPRNRIRTELLPLLESRFNPAVVDVLADAAELARGEWLWLEQAADEALDSLARFGDGEIDLDVAALNALPVGLRRIVLWRAMSRLTGRPVAFGHVTEAAALLRPAAGGSHLDIPGQTVNRVGGRLVLTGRAGVGQAWPVPAGDRKTNLFEYSLSIPGEVLIPEAGGLVSAEIASGTCPAPGARQDEDAGGAREAVVRRDLCGSRLTVRNRRPGDRLRPIGLGGAKKLQDLFVDRKVPRGERDRIPLVVAENGRILWVAGYGIAEEFRVTDPAQPMLILRFKGLGGSA